MKTTSLRSRVILYLAKYNYVSTNLDYGAPPEITQDGIAVALGITRAYASLVLGRLEKTDTVEHVSAQIKNSRSRLERNIYSLTNQGRLEYDAIVRQLAEEGLTPDDVVMADLNHCSTDVIMDRPENEMRIIGAICVLRIPMSRSELPPDCPKTVPVNIQNMVYMKEDTRRRVLSRSTPEQLCSYHSTAADWCIDLGKDLDERIYHLVKARRYREAARLVSSNRDSLIGDADEGQVAVLTELCMRYGDAEVGEVTARMALSLGMHGNARTAVECSQDMDPCIRDSLLAEINLDEGNLE